VTRHDVALAARELLDAEGRNLDGDVSMFPVMLQPLVLGLRRLSHADYVRLVDVCKGRQAPLHLLEGETSEEMRAFIRALSDLLSARGVSLNDDGVRTELLRLTRTERPHDGYSVLEKAPEGSPRDYAPTSTLLITLRGHTARVEPDPQNTARSVVIVGVERLTLTNGQSLVLGRADTHITTVLDQPLPQPRILPVDLRLGDGDAGMSRSCLRITRLPNGRLMVFDVGAKSGSVRVSEQQNGRLVSLADYRPNDGQTAMLGPDEIARLRAAGKLPSA
jgi:hypothetical protein